MKTAQLKMLSLATAVLGGSLLTQTADAAVLVYEPFNYGTAAATRAGADLLQGQPDGSGGDVNAVGLGGTWNDTSGPGAATDLFLASGSLSFGDLPTAGNHVRSDTNNNADNFGRPVTADLGSGSTMWFSFLGNKLQNNFSAAEGGVVIGNQQVNNTRILDDDGSTGLQGVGIAPTTAGNNWTAYAWDGSSQQVGDAVFGVPTNGSETNLLVGELSFNTGAGGTDEFTAYYYTLNGGSIVGGTLNQIASTIEVDLDETTLDFLSMTRQVNTAYDEIRIATTLDEAIGIPEPASLGLIGLSGLLLAGRGRRRD